MRIFLIIISLLLSAGFAPAALKLSFGSDEITATPRVITVGNLNDAETDGSGALSVSSSGSLPDAGGTLTITVEAASWNGDGDWSVDSGHSISINTLTNYAPSPSGWGVVGGRIGNYAGGQLLAITLDASDVVLPTNTQLRIAGFSVDTASAARYIVDGMSDITFPAGTLFPAGTPLSSSEAVRVGFSATDVAYKLSSITLDTHNIASLKGTRPNIIFFLGDDQNITDQSVYGNINVPTPVTQSFSEGGLVFEKAFTGQAICAPSRSMLFTGRYPLRNGCFINHTEIRPRIHTLPEYLVPLGYNVILAGKSHVGPDEQFPWTHRMYSLAATNGRPHGLIPIEKIDEFLADPGPNPFCMVVTSHYPHPPFITNMAYEVNGQVFEPGTPGYNPLHASIAQKEAEFSAVLDSVESNGLSADTIIFFSDDHGMQGKFTCYDRGLNVAFMVRWPANVFPGRTDKLISFTDFLPTAIELAGGTAPATLDGRSLLPILEGRDEDVHDYVYGVAVNQGIIERKIFPQRSLHDGRYHYVWNFNSLERIEREGITNYFHVHGAEEFPSLPEEELYDTLVDPAESSNLAGRPDLADVQARLKMKLFDWMEEQSDYLAENKSSPFLKTDAYRLDQDSPLDPVPQEYVDSLTGLFEIPHDITDPNLTAESPYIDWVIEHNLFGSKMFDEDRDGFSNLYEFALGGDPSSPDDHGSAPFLVRQRINGSNVLSFVHLQRVGTEGQLLYELHGRTNLIAGSWEPMVPVQTIGAEDAGYVSVTNRISMGPASEQFFKLTIKTLD